MPATPPNPLQRMLRQAARRDFYAQALRQVGLGLAIACGVAIVILAVDRSLGFDLSRWTYAGIVALGAIVGIVAAAITRRPYLDIAVQLDHALALKDRVGSALSLDRPSAGFASRDEGFAEMVRQDAASLADRIDLAAATPIQLTGVWGVALLMGLALWAGVTFLPNFATQRPSPSQAELVAQQQQQVEARRQAEELAASIAQARQAAQLNETAADNQATAAQLDALDRLAEQLKDADAKKPDAIKAAREESAAQIDDLADRMAQQAQHDLEAAREMQERFSGMDSEKLPPAPMSAQEFADAVKRGDFGSASEDLERLLQESNESYSKDQRAAAADMLRELARQIEKTSSDSKLSASERAEQVRQALRDMGVDDQTAQRLLDAKADSPPLGPEEARRMLRDQGVDEELAERLARDIENLRQEARRDDQVGREARDLSRAIDRAADDVEQGASPHPTPPASPTSPTPPPPSTQSPSSSPQTRPTDTTTRDAGEQRTDQRDRPEASPDKTSAEQPPQQQATPQPNAGDSQQPHPADNPSQPRDQRSTSSSSPSPSDTRTATSQQAQRDEGSSPTTQHDSVMPDEGRDESASPEAVSAQPQPADSTQEPSPTSQPTNATSQDARSKQPQQTPTSSSSSDQREAVSPQTQPSNSGPPQSRPSPAGTTPSQQLQQQQQDSDADSSNLQEREIPRDQQDKNGKPSQTPDASQLPQPGQSPEQDKALGEMLRRMAERERNAENQQEQSEKLRELARKLADTMSPEQRKRWEDLIKRELGDQRPDMPQDLPPDARQPQSRDEHSPQPGDKQHPNPPSPGGQDAGNDNPQQPPGQGERHAPSRDRNQENAPDAPAAGRTPDDQQEASDDGSASSNRNDRDPRSVDGRGGNKAGTSKAPDRRDEHPPKFETEGTDTVDLRGDEAAQRLIAQWLSDSPPAPESNDPVARAMAASASAEAAQRVKDAQRVAERAVNDSAVNKRYHKAIQRYFGRLQEAIDKAARGEPPAPASDSPTTTATPAASQPS